MDTQVWIDGKKSKGKKHFVVVGCNTGKTYRLDRKFKFTNQAIKSKPFTCPIRDGENNGKVKKPTRVHWDTVVPGFALLIGQQSKTFYFCRGRMARIGRHGEWTSEQARKEAIKLKAEFDKGNDPVEDRRRRKAQQQRDKAEREARGITLQHAYDDYMRRPLRDSTRRQYERLFEQLPWHGRAVVEITSDMVSRLHDRLTKGDQPQKGTKPRKGGARYADQVLNFLGAILKEVAASREGPDGKPILTIDPTRILKRRRQPMTRRIGYIKDDDLPAYFKALDQVGKLKKPSWAALGCDLLEFLTLTGLRLSEATSLEWSRVKLDGDQPEAFISERKNRRPHVVPLTAPIVELLERRKVAAGSSPWVFPSVGWFEEPTFPAVGWRNRDGHLYDADKVKTIVCKRAKMPWFMNHDLRRTFIRAAHRVRIPELDWKLLLGHQVDDNVTYGYVVDILAEELRPSMEAITAYFEDMRAKGRMKKILKFAGG